MKCQIELVEFGTGPVLAAGKELFFLIQKYLLFALNYQIGERSVLNLSFNMLIYYISVCFCFV